MRASPEMPATFRQGPFRVTLKMRRNLRRNGMFSGYMIRNRLSASRQPYIGRKGFASTFDNLKNTSRSQVRLVSIAFNVLAEVLSPPLPFF